jgi:DNA-binding NarL/FixJ family response regulator
VIEDHDLPTLSRTEVRLLELVADGRALTAAGAELALSPGAVSSTVVDLRERFGVARTAAVVAAARDAGMLPGNRVEGERRVR